MKKVESIRYDILIENIKNLSLQDKEELKLLLEKYILEELRTIIYKNYVESLQELKEGKLEFYSDINKLKEIIES